MSIIVITTTQKGEEMDESTVDVAPLRPAEAAAYSGLTVGQLAQLRYRKKGPKYLKPTSRTILYRRSDLDAFLAASEQNGAA